MRPSSRSISTGPGSRGGRWHDQEYRRAYHRAWRAAHPEYREREALRQARRRAAARGDDPGAITGPRRCPCPECRCSMPTGVLCGFCAAGEHES